jgi:hypothetical protein
MYSEKEVILQMYKIYEISSSKKKYIQDSYILIFLFVKCIHFIFYFPNYYGTVKRFFFNCFARVLYIFSQQHTRSKSEKHVLFSISLGYPLEYFVISRLFLSQIIFFNICRQAIKQLILINMIDLNDFLSSILTVLSMYISKFWYFSLFFNIFRHTVQSLIFI